MIHDDSNGRIGIVPHSTSTKASILKEELPNEYLPSARNFSNY